MGLSQVQLGRGPRLDPRFRRRRTARIQRNQRNQRGETLLEVLVTVALAGIVVVTVMGSISTGLRVSQAHRRLASAELLAGNYSEAMSAAPYVTCAQTLAYESPVGLDVPAGFSIDVTSVQLWDDGSNPPTFSDVPLDCVTDSGMQKVTFTVERAGEDVLTRTIVKRFDGPTTTRSARCPVTVCGAR